MQIKYKIKIIYLLGTGLALFNHSIHAQELRIVKKNKAYWQQVQADSQQKMTELKTLIPNIVFDLRYATKNNFTGTKLYGSGRKTFLRRPAADALKKVQEELKSSGLSIKVYDAYRPYRVTKKMWELVHDERYVANPAKGSGHNRGLAVDLTLVDLQTGSEINMGTAFDNFTDTAHHDFKDLPTDILLNRSLLKTIMEKYGFRAFETEWWHYSWPNDRNYEVLDLDFKKLE